MTPLIIIAKHKESVVWARGLPAGIHPMIYEKEIDLPNVGREAATYFHFIVKHYADMHGEIIFCQGNPFDHDPNFMANIQNREIRTYGAVLTCDPHGQPQCDWTDLHAFSKVLDLPIFDKYKFVQGSQFKVHAEQIRRRPKSFYDACLAIAQIDGNKSPWVFERIYCIIFGLDL